MDIIVSSGETVPIQNQKEEYSWREAYENKSERPIILPMLLCPKFSGKYYVDFSQFVSLVK
jgi:hypothetical protein